MPIRNGRGLIWHIAVYTAAVLSATLAGSWAPIRAQDGGTVTITLSGRARQPGEVMWLGVSCACRAAGAHARVFGHDVPLHRAADEWQGLIGIDLDVAAGAYAVTVRIERESRQPITATRMFTVTSKRFPTRRLSVAPEFVNPPDSEAERIQDEAKKLAVIYEHATTPRQWSEGFQVPVSAPPNSSFGTRSVFNGQARSPHSGADFPAPTGTPVAAPAPGVVVLAAAQYFTGNTLVIDHGLGLYSVLAHLSTMSVHAGERVAAGQMVGQVGATGRVTGAHLHWSVRLNGARVDPLSLIAATSPAKKEPGTKNGA